MTNERAKLLHAAIGAVCAYIAFEWRRRQLADLQRFVDQAQIEAAGTGGQEAIARLDQLMQLRQRFAAASKPLPFAGAAIGVIGYATTQRR